MFTLLRDIPVFYFTFCFMLIIYIIECAVLCYATLWLYMLFKMFYSTYYLIYHSSMRISFCIDAWSTFYLHDKAIQLNLWTFLEFNTIRATSLLSLSPILTLVELLPLSKSICCICFSLHTKKLRDIFTLFTDFKQAMLMRLSNY